ncbi:hypothetical protein [Insolitispirillum peregrinum]|uniref:hypothetical protein n=1 Tax=Insolitispirillum peregrinum TaxID=80876 RepID=UPI00361EA18C
MSSSPHIVAYATPHGYGHAAILTAALRSVAEQRPDVRISVVSTVPGAFFRERLTGMDFQHYGRGVALDFGMKMASASDVLVDDSAAAYRAGHRHWKQHVQEEQDFLRSLKPSLVLSCAAYLPLAAANTLGIPACSIGPFTWLGIAASFFTGQPDYESLIAPMRDAYGNASALLATTPAIAWEDCVTDRRIHIGPVCSPCSMPSRQLRQQMEAVVGAGRKIALVALGGIQEPLSMLDHWPDTPDWVWLASSALPRIGLSVNQALTCVDAVITKPGYGTYIEAACAGTPLLYRSRPFWPETTGLARWLAHYTGVEEISEQDFQTGTILPALERACSAPRTPLQVVSGNHQVATLLQDYF